MRANFEIGANGLSLISLPAMTGMTSSRSVASARRMRDFAWPRRPSRMKLWRERERVHVLRNHGLVVADDAGEDRAALCEAGEEIGAHLVLHGTAGEGCGGVRRLLERAECFWVRRRHGQLRCGRVKT